MSNEKIVRMDELKKRIIKYKRRIKRAKLELAKIKLEMLEIWDTCHHNWFLDPSVNFDDHVRHYCSKCDLWKDRSLYQ